MKCTIIHCSNKYYAKGLCQLHYDNNKRRGSPLSFPILNKSLPCSVEGCDKRRKIKLLCGNHWMTEKRRNSPELRKQEYQQLKVWRKNNPEVLASQQASYRQRHKAQLSSYFKGWLAGNRASYNAYQATRKKRVKIATPVWADLAAIQSFYFNCPQGYHVDHVVPINGSNVSGLHVIENLQYLPASDNLKKSNKF